MSVNGSRDIHDYVQKLENQNGTGFARGDGFAQQWNSLTVCCFFSTQSILSP